MKLLFPPKCVFCGTVTDGGTACAKCAATLPVFGREAEGGEFFSKCVCAFRYDGAVRDAVKQLKFGGQRYRARGLAPYMAELAARELGGFDVISWPPIGAARRRGRGFDQSELLAEYVSRELSVPKERLLRKVRETPPQSGLHGKARRAANVMGAYTVCKNVRGRRILLIDDVFTTGATLSECARMLMMAGAADVQCVTAACAQK